VPVYNPAFDVTPHRYLTGIITEEGICYPPFEVSLRRVVEAAERRRVGGELVKLRSLVVE
jgi:methylthioribose-1-phosphate isomerase